MVPMMPRGARLSAGCTPEFPIIKFPEVAATLEKIKKNASPKEKKFHTERNSLKLVVDVIVNLIFLCFKKNHFLS